jgi:arylsulfatase A-like enzyme
MTKIIAIPDPHHPFNPPGKYWDRYQPEQFSLETPISAFSTLAPPLAFAHKRFKAGGVADTPQEAFAATDRQCLEAMALSAGMLGMIDDAVGSIVDQLEVQGLSDNTVILFTSDHGDYMGDGNLLLKGPWLRQNLHHVPMIWSDPTGSRGENDVLGSSIDLAPTILGRAGVEPYFGLQGRDLLDDVANNGGRDSLLIEFNDNVPRLGLTKPARTRTVYRKDGRLTVFAVEGYGELYDSGLDPSHLSNRWDDAASVDLKVALLEELSVLMAEAMDESPRSFYRA